MSSCFERFQISFVQVGSLFDRVATSENMFISFSARGRVAVAFQSSCSCKLLWWEQSLTDLIAANAIDVRECDEPANPLRLVHDIDAELWTAPRPRDSPTPIPDPIIGARTLARLAVPEQFSVGKSFGHLHSTRTYSQRCRCRRPEDACGVTRSAASRSGCRLLSPTPHHPVGRKPAGGAALRSPGAVKGTGTRPDEARKGRTTVVARTAHLLASHVFSASATRTRHDDRCSSSRYVSRTRGLSPRAVLINGRFTYGGVTR